MLLLVFVQKANSLSRYLWHDSDGGCLMFRQSLPLQRLSEPSGLYWESGYFMFKKSFSNACPASEQEQAYFSKDDITSNLLVHIQVDHFISISMYQIICTWISRESLSPEIGKK